MRDPEMSERASERASARAHGKSREASLAACLDHFRPEKVGAILPPRARDVFHELGPDAVTLALHQPAADTHVTRANVTRTDPKP